MKMLYCKCCNRHISSPQFNTHRESKVCRANHAKKCAGDNHRKDVPPTMEHSLMTKPKPKVRKVKAWRETVDYFFRFQAVNHYPEDKYKLIKELEPDISSLLSRQKEQMLEVTRGMKKTEQENNEYAEYTQAGYNRALSDVEEKLKKL